MLPSDSPQRQGRWLLRNAPADPIAVEVWEGDITALPSIGTPDGIVNAANETLLGGGGVDGAIHAAAGPELLAECRTLGGCEPGDAKITAGYQLGVSHVIHTVGPRWRGGTNGEADILASAYRRSLEHAIAHRLISIAFPAISTGVFGYPPDDAAAIAITTIIDTLRTETTPPQRIALVAFDRATTNRYVNRLNDHPELTPDI